MMRCNGRGDFISFKVGTRMLMCVVGINHDLAAEARLCLELAMWVPGCICEKRPTGVAMNSVIGPTHNLLH